MSHCEKANMVSMGSLKLPSYNVRILQDTGSIAYPSNLSRTLLEKYSNHNISSLFFMLIVWRLDVIQPVTCPVPYLNDIGAGLNMKRKKLKLNLKILLYRFQTNSAAFFYDAFFMTVSPFTLSAAERSMP